MEIEAFILIGGKSSRMGRDKALLKLGGVTLAERAVKTTAEALTPKQIYLVAAYEDQFSAEDLPKNIPVMYDIYQDLGAYGALHAALKQARSEWIFVLACDLPFVTVDLLKFMAGMIDGTFEAIVNAAPDGRLQPLCAFYKTEKYLPLIEAMLQSKDRLPPLTRLLEKVSTKTVKPLELQHLPASENFFINVNTKEDMTAAEEILAKL
jgi:molybdopterin-guanine dinucleotide biosynthesis protein A